MINRNALAIIALEAAANEPALAPATRRQVVMALGAMRDHLPHAEHFCASITALYGGEHARTWFVGRLTSRMRQRGYTLGLSPNRYAIVELHALNAVVDRIIAGEAP